MPLAAKITKTAYDVLDAGLKAAYVPIEGTEEYKLDVAGFVLDQDPGALLRAKEHEKKARIEAEQKLADIEQQRKDAIELADQERLRKKGDIDELEKRWSTKLDSEKKILQEKIDQQNRLLANQMIDQQAASLAAELCGENAAIMLPHIKSRLKVEFDQGEAKLRVLDDKGQPSIDTVENLKQAMVANKLFAPIIVQSQANGGSSGAASRSTSSGGGGKKWSDYSSAELKAIRQQNPAEYDRLVKARGEAPTF